MLQELFTYPFLIRIFNNIFKDKIKIISLNKFFNNLKIKFTYDKQINIRLYNNEIFSKLPFDKQIKILKSRYDFLKSEWFFHRLTNVVVDDFYELPSSVTRLTFGGLFNKDVKGYIPNSVIYLKFDICFNQCIENCIPNSVEHLKFGYSFEQKIENLIPNSVTHLTLTNFLNYTYYHGNIPPSITHLKIRNRIRGPIDCIPRTVTHLNFGKDFDQSIESLIPNSVTHLTWGSNIFESSGNCIPSSVVYLKFKNKFCRSKISSFPSLLRYLHCSKEFYENNKQIINDNVKVELI